MGVRLYLGLANETKWNHHPINTGGFSCVSPMTGATERTRKENRVAIPQSDSVIQDSGAFNDSTKHRLCPKDALLRQIEHADKYEYQHLISHRASYDLLIDEKWRDGKRYKQRWSVSEAESAVELTVQAARWLAEHRYLLPFSSDLVLSAQGVSAEQYADCVTRIIPLLNCERDILGLGGWCIIGKQTRRMVPVFLSATKLLMEILPDTSVRRIHIWGVIYPNALGVLLWVCKQLDISLSTDSAGPSWRPAFGEWGYGDWKDKSYERVPTTTRGLHRARHVAETREWLLNLEHTQYFRSPWDSYWKENGYE